MRMKSWIGKLVLGMIVCLWGFSGCQSGVMQKPVVESVSKSVAAKPVDPHPIVIHEGDRRIRHDFEEWSVWAEGETPDKTSATAKVYSDPEASAKQVGGLVFQEVDADTDRQQASYRFYISSTFFRYGYDVFVRYATKDMGIDCEFIYQEGTKYEGPKPPITLKRTTMKPTTNWRGTYRWERLGRINTTRGWHRLIVKSTGGSINIDAFAIATHGAYVTDGRADRDIADKNAGIYTAGGVSLGGIGAGKFELCRDGKIRNLVTNNNWDAPLNELNGSFFAAWSKPSGGGASESVLRALVLRSEYDLPPVVGIDYDPRFPTVGMKFNDPALPVEVSLEAFSPLVPNNVKDSALPVAVFAFTLANPSTVPQETSLAFSWENIVGLGAWGDPRRYFFWDDRDGNHQQFVATDGMKGILFKNRKSRSPLADGDYTVACLEQPGVEVTYNLQWDLKGDGRDGWESFAKAGRLEDNRTKAKGNPGAAILAATTTLKPGERRTVRFVLAWDMPHLISARGRTYGHAHNNHFQGSWAVAEYAMKNHERLHAGTTLVQKHLAASNLPRWFVRRLLNDGFPIYANTWLTKDDKFSVNESPNNMNGCMGTMDQRFVSGTWSAMFFPVLDKNELDLFGISQSKKTGAIPHDLGHSHLDKHTAGTGGGDWPDLTLAFTLQCYRQYLWRADEKFIARMYPRMKRAMDYCITVLDKDGNGIPNVRGGLLGTTYDDQWSYGTVDFIGSQTLTALLAMEDLANRRGDPEYAKLCRARFDKARKSFEDELWNGTYYRHFREIKPRVVKGVEQPLEVSEGCHLAQLAGQWFADSVDLGPIQDIDKMDTAVATMMRLNGNQKWWVPPDHVNARGELDFEHTVSWVLFAEAYLCSLAFQHGHPDDGFRVMENIHKTIEREGNDPFDVRLMYRPTDGGAAWGRWYMTAASSWNVLRALEGFTVDLPRKKLGLSVSLPKSFDGKLSAPLFSPTFWAWLDYAEATKDGQTERAFELRWLEGSPSKAVAFEALTFALPRSAKQIKIEIDGKPVTVTTFDAATGRLVVHHTVRLAEGSKTTIQLQYNP